MLPTTLLGLVASLLPLVHAGRAPTINRFGNDFLSAAFYLDLSDRAGTTGFSYWVQNSGQGVIDLLKSYGQRKGQPDGELTVLMPSTPRFAEWISAQGGNASDPETLSTPEWCSKWGDALSYFFVAGHVNFTEMTSTHRSLVFDTAKMSPVGNWPLTVAFQRNAADKAAALAQGMAYNGSVVSSAGSSGPVVLADQWATTVAVQVVDFWPAEPLGLAESMSALGVANWSEVARRVPKVAALATQRNFTLFVPPAASWASAVARSDAQLASFVDGHLVPDQRLILPEAYTPLTLKLAGGQSLTTWTTKASVGAVTVNVIQRDVQTNGGVLQLLDGPLVALPAAAKRNEL